MGHLVDDETALVKLANDSSIKLEPSFGGNRVLIDGRDVSMRVREPDVTEAASRVSVHPKVRAWMVSHQQEMGAGGGIVMEGRDIGTKVFPDADVKIFLDADPVVRKRRGLNEPRKRRPGITRGGRRQSCASATGGIEPGLLRRWCLRRTR